MKQYILMLTTALTLTACSSGSLFESWDENSSETQNLIASGSMYKIEKPYEVNGVWYFPAENYSYSEKGMASWYMPANSQSAKTANGEQYIATEMSARHKTLPLPSIVKITNLDNNKSIIARVNDRGPMDNNRLIDVSQKAAQELDFPVTGTTPVLVEVLPQESQEIRDALLAAGRVYTDSDQLIQQDLSIVPPMPVPEERTVVTNEPIYVNSEPVYQNKTQTETKTVPAGSFYIQLGAYGDAQNAAKAKQVASSLTPVTVTQKVQGGRTLSVVKAGPYATRSEAEQALKSLKQSGYRDAYIAK